MSADADDVSSITWVVIALNEKGMTPIQPPDYLTPKDLYDVKRFTIQRLV